MSKVKLGEIRINCFGNDVKAMATADGYVMARHPRCIPFVIGEREFLALRLKPKTSAAKGAK